LELDAHKPSQQEAAALPVLCAGPAKNNNAWHQPSLFPTSLSSVPHFSLAIIPFTVILILKKNGRAALDYCNALSASDPLFALYRMIVCFI
jgi:hypothetical protein